MPKMVSSIKQRIDILLVERGLADSLEKAQAIVMAGKVTANGQLITKPGMSINRDMVLELIKQAPFVSRGGIKLNHAIEEFGLNVSGKIAADIGASTGGFTDCLLKHGVKLVYAIDVGKGQLDWRLRQDPRVVVLEDINARYPIDLPKKIDLVTIDVSFISVEKVIPSAAALLREDGYLVVLIKPQFEALKREVSKGGIIKNPEIHAQVLGRFLTWAIAHDYQLNGLLASPIEGASGNREFFILLKRSIIIPESN
jgi:23S rRNA (cytidine1920-2'-O)/16S rRNA (cytidine1409-2'-O)-methyltransferase